MRTIIAGSRDISDYALVCRAIRESGFTITKVVSGRARGVDLLGERWAKSRGIPIDEHPADWLLYRGNAGHVRNVQMGNHADALIAVWDGTSTGTADMIAIARERRLKIHIVHP